MIKLPLIEKSWGKLWPNDYPSLHKIIVSYIYTFLLFTVQIKHEETTEL
jgi:hypothetical protein